MINAPVITEPRYQFMPEMSPADFRELKNSIARVGFLPEFAVVIDENGRILDGHHRARACAELGIECLTRLKEGLSEEEKDEYIWVVNIGRRHLTMEQKRELIRHRLRSRPEESNRSIAAQIGVSNVTVGKIRAELEATSEIESVIRPHQRQDQGVEDYAGALDDVEERLLVGRIHVIAGEVLMRTGKTRTRYGMEYEREKKWQQFAIHDISIPSAVIENAEFAEDAFWNEIRRQGRLKFREKGYSLR